jgi:hypothetical protein
MKKTVNISKDETVANSSKVYADNQIYPASEDIYNQEKQETEIDPEDVSKKKPSHADDGKFNEKNFNQDKSGSDLDIPGSELDIALEETITMISKKTTDNIISFALKTNYKLS